VFDCGPLGDGGHGHYDLLSIDAAAGGRSLVVDPGRFTYAEGVPNLRHWFRSTAAHNTVTVDGLDQTPYARGMNRGAVARGEFLGRTTACGVDVLRGRASSPCYDATHTRTVVFVDHAYWVVEDLLEAAQCHRYDLRFHLAPDADGATLLEGADVSAPGLVLVLDGADDVVLEPGWVAPAYGVKQRAPVVSAVRTAHTAVFTSLLFPLAAGAAAPRFRVTSQGAVSSVEVEHGRRRDKVVWTRDSASLRREERP
jgi:hypothetical protein